MIETLQLCNSNSLITGLHLGCLLRPGDSIDIACTTDQERRIETEFAVRTGESLGSIEATLFTRASVE